MDTMRFLPSADLPLQEYLESHGRRAAFEFGGQECPPSLVAGEDPDEGLVEVVVGAADVATEGEDGDAEEVFFNRR